MLSSLKYMNLVRRRRTDTLRNGPYPATMSGSKGRKYIISTDTSTHLLLVISRSRITRAYEYYQDRCICRCSQEGLRAPCAHPNNKDKSK